MLKQISAVARSSSGCRVSSVRSFVSLSLRTKGDLMKVLVCARKYRPSDERRGAATGAIQPEEVVDSFAEFVVLIRQQVRVPDGLNNCVCSL
jgi:hypothetical protein